MSNLLAAIGALGREGVRLHLYTAQSREAIEVHGMPRPRRLARARAGLGDARVHGEADVLFLPLAFRSPYPDIVRTAAPGKMGEYLAARRPILVHAPADSFVSWYFRGHECGVVVDESDPVRLAEGIERILGDAGLRGKLAVNAWERARADFSVSAARAAFARLLGLSGGGRR